MLLNSFADRAFLNALSKRSRCVREGESGSSSSMVSKAFLSPGKRTLDSNFTDPLASMMASTVCITT
ncbi:MAG: hypothetical protein K1X52_08990 [Pyrinomonadaceae bacterium]|nr:hypothetical protein [Pyrinomonadaceae bacterium]